MADPVITPEDEFKRRARLEGLFNSLDKTGDGELSHVELSEFVRTTFKGAVSPLILKTATNQAISRHDADGNGTINFEEFVTIYAKLIENPELPVNIKKQAHDNDHTFVPASGEPLKVPAREFILTEADKDAAKAEFNKYDADKSGCLSKDEFKALCKARLGKRTGESILNRMVDSEWSFGDKNGDGRIDEHEFLRVYAKIYLAQNPK